MVVEQAEPAVTRCLNARYGTVFKQALAILHTENFWNKEPARRQASNKHKDTSSSSSLYKPQ